MESNKDTKKVASFSGAKKVSAPSKPKVKKVPTLHRGPETILANITVGSLFEIGDVLYRIKGKSGIGIQVIVTVPIPGGFRTGRELTMGDHTICLPVDVVK